ncbi:MAG: aldo/keto reductase [Candidatus Micrarchaeaceae archaeon]
MDFINLGNTKEKIPVLGIGTWKLGAEREVTINIIKNAIHKGLTLVDTAQMYQNEEIVGQAIRNEKVFLATKVSPHNFHESDIINSCSESLNKLKIKTIDLYQLHWPNPNVKIIETMRAMEKLVDEGKIRYIGVSNFSINELESAMGVMKKYEIVSNQIEYSVMTRDVGDSLSDFCKKNHISIIAYSPLGGGKLFDKKYENVLTFLTNIGKKYGKTPTQVALNWLLQKENLCAIPKFSSKEHLNENLGSMNWKLSKEDLELINNLGQSKKPLSSMLNPITKRMAPLWSNLMTKNERKRINYKKENEKD